MNDQDKKLCYRLLSLFSPYKFKLLLIFLCLLVTIVVSLSLPILSKTLVDDGIMRSDLGTVVKVCLVIISLAMTNAVFEVLKETVRSGVAASFYQTLFVNAIKALSSVKIEYFNHKNSTEILNRLEVDITRVCCVCDSNVIFVLTQVLSFIGGIIGLSIIDLRLTVIVLLFFPIKIALVTFFGRRRKKIISTMIQLHQTFAHWLGDMLEGMKEIRLFNLKKKKQAEASERVSSIATTERKIAVLDCYNVVSDTVIIQTLEAVLYICGAIFIFNGSLTIGSLVAFITYSINVMNPLSAVLNLNYMLTGILPSADRYFSFIDEAKNQSEPEDGCPIDTIDTIEMRNGCFSYGEHAVLKDVTFRVSKGEHVGIIGRNGSGKSTIFQLLQRLSVLDSGDILVNGRPISDYNIDSYRGVISCLNQTNHLFDVSVMENVLLYQDVENSRVDQVIEQSRLQPVLDACPGKVGTNGSNLSGGQRQKICFARLLIKDADFIFFDEVTANLDADAEAMILDALGTYLRPKTVLSIVHSWRLLENMDRIIQLDGEGGIKIFDSLEELFQARSESDMEGMILK